MRPDHTPATGVIYELHTFSDGTLATGMKQLGVFEALVQPDDAVVVDITELTNEEYTAISSQLAVEASKIDESLDLPLATKDADYPGTEQVPQ